MRINQIWKELENDKTYSHGLLVRRYSGTILPDVFVALKMPEKIRCIAATVSANAKINLSSFSNLRDISIELLPDENKGDRKILLFKLLNSQHNDIFAVLCEDLMLSIASVSTEGKLIRELFNRFEMWKSLFEKASLKGLSPEEQRGLFGELFLLRNMLTANFNALAVVESWVGCEKQIRDFQYNSWSIEVKTTHGSNHQKLHINSERQLDASNLQQLFLFHLSLEARKKSGETLNDIIKSIREMLQNDFQVLNKFNAKLIGGSYFTHHQELYNEEGYFVRHATFYKVFGDFPRIEEADIRNGVGDVEYSIIVSRCLEYQIAEQELFQILNFV